MMPGPPGLFCVGFDGLTLPDTLQPLLAQGLGGVILFKRNLESLEQIWRLTADLRGSASIPLLIGVDQEGGRVTRLPAPFLAPPAAGLLGRIDDPGLTRELARAVGRELRAAGLNWNLAPVLDVHTNPANPVIGDRAYGGDPHGVARMGLAALGGFEDARILATAKHFPGHGETAADSHLTLPESLQTRDRWRTVEFIPFRAAVEAGVPSIMVAHLSCPALDPQEPSSLSRIVITDILRHELGFGGVVVSDDLEMAAIAARFDIGEAAVRFLEAGGDLILICRDAARQHAAVAAVEAAVSSGRLPEGRVEASLKRIAQMRRRFVPDVDRVDRSAAQSIVGSPAHLALLRRAQAVIAG
jgi:beta-N-acetylhexosaminidase